MKKTYVSGILAMLLCCTMLMSGCGKTDVPPQTTDPAQAGNELSGAAAIKPEGYPKGGTVTVVCGYNAGGAQDNNCRVAAQYASVLSGDNYVVTNIAGSGGRVAAADVTASKADGLKIYLANLTLADPEDYQYVDKETLESMMAMNMLVAEQFDVICAMHDDARSITIQANDPRFSNWEEFSDYALAHPGELTIGTSGATNASGLMYTLLTQKLGYDFNVVHYTSTSEVHAALLGGHIDAEMSVVSATNTDGDVAKTIVVASEERNVLFPDVPTFKELGVELNIPTTRCFFVKKGTDEAIVNYLSALFGEMAEYEPYVEDNHNIYVTTVDYKDHETAKKLIDDTYAACMELLK